MDAGIVSAFIMESEWGKSDFLFVNTPPASWEILSALSDLFPLAIARRFVEIANPFQNPTQVRQHGSPYAGCPRSHRLALPNRVPICKRLPPRHPWPLRGLC